MGKHSYNQKEQDAVWDALTVAEQTEYKAMAFGFELSGAQANRDRMRELVNLGFDRMKERG